METRVQAPPRHSPGQQIYEPAPWTPAHIFTTIRLSLTNRTHNRHSHNQTLFQLSPPRSPPCHGWFPPRSPSRPGRGLGQWSVPHTQTTATHVLELPKVPTNPTGFSSNCIAHISHSPNPNNTVRRHSIRPTPAPAGAHTDSLLF